MALLNSHFIEQPLWPRDFLHTASSPYKKMLKNSYYYLRSTDEELQLTRWKQLSQKQKTVKIWKRIQILVFVSTLKSIDPLGLAAC